MKNRTSSLQKQILKCLVSGLKRGHDQVKSTILNVAVSRQMGKAIHPNRFRVSCATLVDRGLIARGKIKGKYSDELIIWITPKGIDFVENLSE